MSTVLRPLGCRIIVKCDDEIFEDGVTRGEDGKLYQGGGLIQIPDNVAENYERQAMTGTIIAVGNVMNADFNLQKGHRILFGRYAGDWVPDRLDGYKECRMMDEDDVVCVLEEEA